MATPAEHITAAEAALTSIEAIDADDNRSSYADDRRDRLADVAALHIGIAQAQTATGDA